MGDMNERPILFSGEMVRAILDGRKTMTRRVVRPQPPPDSRWEGGLFVPKGCAFGLVRHCPYGSPGERLWVRETWAEVPTVCGSDEVVYAADYTDGSDRKAGVKHKPSIHMPRWASRLLLEVVSVRVERLQEISGVDAVEEGCGLGMPSYQLMHYGGYKKARHAFRELWDTLNAKRGFPWESNPWVWIVGFRKVEP